MQRYLSRARWGGHARATHSLQRGSNISAIMTIDNIYGIINYEFQERRFKIDNIVIFRNDTILDLQQHNAANPCLIWDIAPYHTDDNISLIFENLNYGDCYLSPVLHC